MSSMRYACSLIVCLGIATQISFAAGVERRFAAPGENFSVTMEGTPVVKASAVGTRMWAHDEPSGGYWVTYGTVPGVSLADTARTNQALNGAAGGAVAGMGATATARYSIRLANRFPGQQIEGTLPNGSKFRMRIFLVNERIYQMVSVGSKKYIDSAPVQRFLASLYLGAASAAPAPLAAAPVTAVPSAAARAATAPTAAARTTLAPTHSSPPAVPAATNHAQMAAEMQRKREEMEAKSAALKAKVQEEQNAAHKDAEPVRVRRAYQTN